MNGMTQVRLVDTPEYLDKGLWWPWCSLSGITAFTLVTIPPFICLFRSDDMIDVVRERSRISNLISSKEWKAQVSIWVFLFSFNDWDFFFLFGSFLPDWPIWVVVVVFGICQDFFWVTLREIQTLSSLHPLLLLWLFQESLLLQTQVSLAKNTRENLLSVHILLNKILIKAARPASANNTVFENNRKSLIQHCERSELRLHFKLTKVK